MPEIKKKLPIMLIISLALMFTVLVVSSALLFAPRGTLKIVALPVESSQLLYGELRSSYQDREFLPGETININTATAEELQRLQGIGEQLSAAIVEYRQQNGDFLAIEDIMKVSGIGEKTFENISNYISIGD